jgi:hypothetical protein
VIVVEIKIRGRAIVGRKGRVRDWAKKEVERGWFDLPGDSAR